MVVQHNLTAMNSNRNLGITTAAQAKSTEKLSSGYKINRAADDAAGLSISEKMRKQIRGLTQASANAQDGISAVQTAEGALTEVHDMLQRMNELAVKASNGTMSENDRAYVQSEVDQLVTEIDRVSETTKFNETFLLKGETDGTVGSSATTATGIIGTVDATISAGASVSAGDVALGTIGLTETHTDAAGGDFTGVSVDDTMFANSAMVDAFNTSSTAGVYTLTYDGTDWNDGSTDYTNQELTDAGFTLTGTIGTGDTVVLTKTFTADTASLNENKVTLSGAPAASDIANSFNFGSTVNATIKVDSAGEATLNAYDAAYVAEDLEMDLQVGADTTADNKIGLSISAMSAKALSLLNADGKLLVNGADSTNADAAVTTIGNAIQKVSTQRSTLGAVQNRLEHTINNLDNVVENTTAAESAIRDTDMAEEMVKYSNNNILTQAGQAMLAQANQSNQGVLSLLQ